MSTRRRREPLDLLQGTPGPEHGQGIARAIQQTSADELLVEHGALYPPLQRLEEQPWIVGKWGTLRAAGRRHFFEETSKWKRLAKAIARVLDSGPAEV